MTVNGLPKNWKRLSLGGLCDRIGVGLAMGITQHYSDSGTMLLRNQNIRPDRFDDREILYLSESFSSTQANKKLRPNDVITVRTGAKIGDTCVVPAKYAGSLTFTTLIASPKSEALCSEYLSFYVNSHFGRAEVNRLMAGGGKGNLNSGELKKFQLLIPPYPEQVKIATILSTWDLAIELTEKLIAAKQKRKQAFMQQLLSGKVRFAGFTEKWKSIKAGEIFKPVSDKSHPDERVLSVTQDMGVVYRDEMERKIGMNMDTTGSYKLVEPGDFVISLRSFQGGLEMSRVRGIVSPAYHVIRPVIEIDFDFFRHFFKSYEFVGRLAVAVIGIRDGKQINYEDFGFLKFRFPPIEEQRAISGVLSAAERELGVLHEKVSVLKRQKNGLMQQLLTGKVRVNVDTETVKG
ncbi:MAG: restriction endonuclease subunit S [Planctomycetota bacterium]